ncbi:MAG: Fe-S protein assembly co-chaperone HscB [Phycisphaerales bacterium]|nr:Fe-S protein assembly co-chaperone HscB [Phycisphaerales bacterium]
MGESTSTSRPAAAPDKCSSCDQPLDLPMVCSSCHTLQQAGQLTYFTLLGLEARFDVDAATLRERYLQLMREIHPDRAGEPPAGVELERQRLSARANEAFKTLSSPVLRAEYLLELSGGQSAAEDKRVPPELLGATLMIREEIEEARAASNSSLLAALARKLTSDRDRIVHTVGELARLLPGDAALRSELRLKLNTLRYYDRMIEQIESD